jgi:hypothetical protein
VKQTVTPVAGHEATDVGLGVKVGVSVGQVPPGQGVDVDVGVLVGPATIETVLPNATVLIEFPNGSAREGDNAITVVPGATGSNTT